MMSNIQKKKAAQGYRQHGKHCEECYYFLDQSTADERRLRCGIGGFAVKPRATCDQWVDREQEVLASIIAAGGCPGGRLGRE